MEAWMITVLIVGAIVMFSFWGLMALGSRELKKKGQIQQQDERLDDWSPTNPDDDDDKAVYSTDGKRIR